MTKRLVLLAVILAIPLIVMAAAPLHNGYGVAVNLDTIVNEYGSGTTGWDSVTNLIYTATDTCQILVTVTGVAVFDPMEALYIGFGSDSANRVDSATAATTGRTNSNLDTFLVQPDIRNRAKVRQPFTARYTTTYASQTDLDDTIFVNMATASIERKVEVEDLVFTIQIFDKSAGTDY